MKTLAFVVKGQSFFKIMAPMLSAASKLGITTTLFVYTNRPGKPDDNVNPDLLSKLKKICDEKCMPDIVYVNDDQSCKAKILSHGIRDVVVQDAQHHFPFLLDLLNVFSISVFTDTMHWAKNYFSKSLIPKRSYFPNVVCKKKVEEICNVDWPGLVSGSPMFDHLAWMKIRKGREGSVLFLSPHPNLLSNDQIEELRHLEKHVGKHRFKVFQRKKHLANYGFKSEVHILNKENIPYKSLYEICVADIHINCFSISGFESQFLGKPMLNLDTQCQDNSIGNVLVKNYSLDNVYNDKNRLTIKPGELIEKYDLLVKDRQESEHIINDDIETWNSTFILRDVMKNLL